VLLLSSCDLITGPPDFPGDAEPFAPPPVYAFWWQLMERCSGRDRVYAGVKWYMSPSIDLGGERYNGYWWSQGNRILLSDAHVRNGRVVRHEMLHALIDDGEHPAEYFEDRCGAELGCVQCLARLRGVSAAEREAAQVVGADALDVTMEVERPDDRYWVRDGSVAVVVRARNPLPHPVWVSLPYFSRGTFGYRVNGRLFSQWIDEDRIFFRAGQERRMVFDERLCAPRTHSIEGLFNTHESASLDIEVSESQSEMPCPIAPGVRDLLTPARAR
jgi:hypothetical protein